MPRSSIGVLRALFVAVVALAAISARAQDAVPIITPTMPNYVGVGLGATPDYIGADDYFFGGLPLARYQLKDSFRYASLVGTYVDLNLINIRSSASGRPAAAVRPLQRQRPRGAPAALDQQDDRSRGVRGARVRRPKRPEKAHPVGPALPTGSGERA